MDTILNIGHRVCEANIGVDERVLQSAAKVFLSFGFWEHRKVHIVPIVTCHLAEELRG